MTIDIKRLGIIPFRDAWDLQKKIIKKINDGNLSNQLLLLQHPTTITLGRANNRENLLLSNSDLSNLNIEVIESDRGGDITLHALGQIVGYPLIHIKKDNMDAHGYLWFLEELIIEVLKRWGIKGSRKKEYTGVWVDNKKIAAIGVKFNSASKLKGFITSHGFALNVNTDLTLFSTIVPCGIQEYGVTSMEKVLEQKIHLREVEDEISKIIISKLK